MAITARPLIPNPADPSGETNEYNEKIWHRPLLSLKVVEGGVEGLGSCEIKSCVVLRRIKFLDCELLKGCALSSFVPD